MIKGAKEPGRFCSFVFSGNETIELLQTLELDSQPNHVQHIFL